MNLSDYINPPKPVGSQGFTERTQADLLAPLTPPNFTAFTPPKSSVNLGMPTQPAAPTAGHYDPMLNRLDASMAAHPAVAPQSSPAFLIGSAVANHISTARGYSSGGGGSYQGPGLHAGSNRLLNLARTQLGVPYVFGNEDPVGGGSASFDCSGLTAWAFGRLGITLPHSAAAQSQMFPRVTRDQLRPGDLVFYDYGRLGGASDHVAIYIGNGQQIAASSGASEVTVQSVDWSHFIWGGATPFGGGAIPNKPRRNSRNPQRGPLRTGNPQQR